MKLYWIKSQAPRQVLALIKHLGITAQCVQLKGSELHKPEYIALNPNKKAPTLVDGETVLWEASAIMAYLCIKSGSDLWPSQSPQEQVEVLRWLGWNDCHWSRALGPFYFEHIVKATFGLGMPDRSSLPSKVAELSTCARVLDEHLQERSYVACNRLTIADFRLAAMASSWREAEMPLNEFRNIVRWLDRLQSIPAWANPWPSAVKAVNEESMA